MALQKRSGPKPGTYKHDPESVRRRADKIRGARHYSWKGDAVSERGGRVRALRLFPPGPCRVCGNPRGERHHIDGNTAHNDPANIEMLCRRCHMTADGRLEALKSLARRNQPLASAAAAAARRAKSK